MSKVIAHPPAPTGPFFMTERQKRRGYFADMAKESFADHTVTQIAPNIWSCSRGGSSIYRFEVVFLGHRVIVTGDIGDMVLYCSDPSAAAWARRNVVRDMDYVLGKCSSNFEKHTYEQDLARALLLEREAEAHREMMEAVDDKALEPEERERAVEGFEAFRAKLNVVRENLDRQETFLESWIEEINPHPDYPDATDWSSNLLWCFYALQWLVEKTGEKLLDPTSFPPAPKVAT